MLDYNKLRLMGRRPRLHPNGFIQLDLNLDRSMRLHVWPDAPLPAQKTRHPIHDHSFRMTSTIIHGKLINIVYELYLGAGYTVYRAKKVGPEETILLPERNQIVKCNEFCRASYTPGDSYELGSQILHDSIPDGLTATIFQKSNAMRYEPRVLVPEGVAPDNDYRREDIDEELLWSFIRRVL